MLHQPSFVCLIFKDQQQHHLLIEHMVCLLAYNKIPYYCSNKVQNLYSLEIYNTLNNSFYLQASNTSILTLLMLVLSQRNILFLLCTNTRSEWENLTSLLPEFSDFLGRRQWHKYKHALTQQLLNNWFCLGGPVSTPSQEVMTYSLILKY